MKNVKAVAEFHRAFGVPCHGSKAAHDEANLRRDAPQGGPCATGALRGTRWKWHLTAAGWES